MLSYIVNSTICFSVLYLAYLLLLRNERHFGLNRFVLVSILIISLALPTIVYTHRVEVTVSVPAVESPFSRMGIEENSTEIEPGVADAAAASSAQPINMALSRTLPGLPGALLALYLLGVGFKVLYLLIHLATMRLRLFRSGRCEMVNGVEVLVSDRWGHSFSIFNTIVLTENDFNSSNRNMIISHELAHVRQRHSFDLLFAQLFVALHWFNPLAYMYQKTLRGVHEYLADGQVMDAGTDPVIYQQFILQCIYDTVSPRLANTFSAKQIKNRFAMMKPSHKRNSRAKCLLFVPALAGLFFLFSFRVQEHVVYQYEDTPEIEITTPTPALEVESQVDIQTSQPQPQPEVEHNVVSAPQQTALSINAHAMALKDSALLSQRLDGVLGANYDKLITLFDTGRENPLYSKFTFSLGTDTEIFIATAVATPPLPIFRLINVENDSRVEPTHTQGDETHALVRFHIAEAGKYRIWLDSQKGLGNHVVSLATHKETGVNSEVGIVIQGETVPLKSGGSSTAEQPKFLGGINIYRGESDDSDFNKQKKAMVKTTEVEDKEAESEEKGVGEVASKVKGGIKLSFGKPQDADYLLYSVEYKEFRERRTTDISDPKKIAEKFYENSNLERIIDSRDSEQPWPNGYIQSNIQYPESYKPKRQSYDTVEVRFQLSETAQISDVKVLKGINPEVDAELVRVLESMPGWEPQYGSNGQIVPAIITLEFNLVR